MIGFITKAKVRRFIRAHHSTKILVASEFLTALDSEIERIVRLSAEQADCERVVHLAAKVPEKRIADLLICNQRVKREIKRINIKSGINIVASKRFLDDVNAYAGTIILASLKLVQGTYIKSLAAGDVAVTAVDRKPVEEIPSPDNDENAEPPPYVFKPALPRDHLLVSFTLRVQNVVLNCVLPIYTSKTTKALEHVLECVSQRYLGFLGIHDSVEITITKTERKKKEQ